MQVNSRTKIAIRGQIIEYIPNSTFEVVARPGAMEEYFRVGNPEGKSRREVFGDPMKSIPAFREPGPRLELMDELGIEKSLMFFTLASLVEERMRDDPQLIHAVVHLRIRPVLEARRRARHLGHHALLRQRLLPVHQ